MSETEKYRYHLTYMWNLNKKQNKTKRQAPRFREHISGCHMSEHIRVWEGCGYKTATSGSSWGYVS